MNQLDKKSEAWSALFSEPMSDLVKRYTASVFFDKRLWQADIEGSLAHAGMLAAPGHHRRRRPGRHRDAAWRRSAARSKPAPFDWKLDLEDVHLNIEARLTQLVGDAGKRLHTGRSRNDQVATDVRLWLRGEIDLICAPAGRPAEGAAGHRREERRGDPARLHAPAGGAAGELRPPHAGLCGDVRRDAERMADVRKRVNRLPLGAAALAGTSYPLDRELVATHAGHGRRLPELAWTR